MKEVKIMGERSEALFRIVVLIVTGIILGLWKGLVQVTVVIHWIYVIFSGKRSGEIAKFTNYYVTLVYKYIRYLTFATNERPFPFGEFGKPIMPVDMKKK